MASVSKKIYCSTWPPPMLLIAVIGLTVLGCGLVFSMVTQATVISLILLPFVLTLSSIVTAQLIARQQPKLTTQDMLLITNLLDESQRYLNEDRHKMDLVYSEESDFNSIVKCMHTLNLKHLNCENLVQELAIQVQEKSDQLKAQQKMDRDRSENLHKMFAGASHDLRQPLQAMVIFISAIQESASKEQAPMLQKLEQVVENLNHMFTDLLDISKLESRMKRIPKKNVEIKPLLEKIYDEFEALAHDKRIEFRLYNRDLSVYSNPNMLERIIRNMISNAIRYTRRGGVLIGCRQREDEVWIEVWDTGRGIPQDKMDVIFDEFVQIPQQSEDSEEVNKGVGLGLFIVKRLAQLLDHSIIARSALHRGTLFRIVVPGQPLYPHCDYPKQLPPAMSTLNLNDGSPLNVVFIDDDGEIREAMSELLGSWQMEVDTFDGLESLQSADETQLEWDLVISDFQLGSEHTGLEAIDLIRRQQSTVTPAIIITGTEDGALIETIKTSAIPWLKKPVKPAKLRALINMLLSAKKLKK